MRYGGTFIDVIHEDDPTLDFTAITEQLEAMPGVKTAFVVWQNETLEDWEEEQLAAAMKKGNRSAPASNPGLKRRLLRR